MMCSIYSADGAKTPSGYHHISNMIDTVMLVLSGHDRFWESNHWTQSSGAIKWTLGLPKELSIYEAGLHEHPFYGGVVMCDFSRTVPPQRVPRNVGEAETLVTN
jgi:hypothetical protein